MGADIYSDEGKDLKVAAFGFESAYSVDIYCSAGSACSIDCLHDGCHYTRFFCHGDAQCDAQCGEDDECPSILDWDGVAAMASDTEQRMGMDAQSQAKRDAAVPAKKTAQIEAVAVSVGVDTFMDRALAYESVLMLAA